MALREPRYPNNWFVRAETCDVPRKTVWHGYLLTQEEQRSLDYMMGRALLDSKFCQRLLEKRDANLLAEFNFSSATEEWLCSIQAASLNELAQAVSFG